MNAPARGRRERVAARHSDAHLSPRRVSPPGASRAAGRSLVRVIPPRWAETSSRAGVALAIAIAAASLTAGAAHAQRVRPWTPAFSDSVVAWAADARAQFQTNLGDSSTGNNYQAYERVGRIGRRLIRSLGRENITQVEAIKPVLDSLALDTELARDPSTPQFVLLMVRNPFRLTADAVGFLYWFRGDDLRMQGVVFHPSVKPKMRVWWTGRPTAPYEWGILDEERTETRRAGLLLLRLNADGYYWNIVQFGTAPLGDAKGAQAFWIDVNGDGAPEIVSWSRAEPDSAFEECMGCPRLQFESLFTEHEQGFSLQDGRLLPSPYSTFVLFIRLLREGNRSAATRLLETPSKVTEAVMLGWNARAARGTWKLEYAEEDQPWPRWLALRHRSGTLYIVHFTMKDGRWIIRDWKAEAKRAGTPAKSGASKR